MPFYIATVWRLGPAANTVDGEKRWTRQVTRRWAENADRFEAELLDIFMANVDDLVEVGPIGLSKDQRSPA